MEEHTLELRSSHGDQTLSGIRYVVHEVANAQDPSILPEGELRFTEGTALATADLTHGFGHGAHATGLVVIASPLDYHIGYATFTSVQIDRAGKQVTGYPAAYAEARSRLGWYLDADVEAERQRVEGELLAGYTAEHRPSFVIAPEYIVGHWPRSDTLMAILSQLAVAAAAFESHDYSQFESTLAGVFEAAEPPQAVIVPSMVHSLVLSTVESVVMSKLRLLRWQGLQLAGYSFTEGNATAELPAIGTAPAFEAELTRLQTKLSAHPFTGELAWLDGYAANELTLIRVERNGL